MTTILTPSAILFLRQKNAAALSGVIGSKTAGGFQ
jgi:hypothetical protein